MDLPISFFISLAVLVSSKNLLFSQATWYHHRRFSTCRFKGKSNKLSRHLRTSSLFPKNNVTSLGENVTGESPMITKEKIVLKEMWKTIESVRITFLWICGLEQEISQKSKIDYGLFIAPSFFLRSSGSSAYRYGRLSWLHMYQGGRGRGLTLISR